MLENHEVSRKELELNHAKESLVGLENTLGNMGHRLHVFEAQSLDY